MEAAEGIHIAGSRQKLDFVGGKNVGQKSKGAKKQPFTPLDNMWKRREESSKVDFRRPICDSYPSSSPMVGSKLPRSNVGNIKDKISLWENKESTLSHLNSGSLSKSASLKPADSSTNGSNRTVDNQSSEIIRTGPSKKQDLGKENIANYSNSGSFSLDELSKQPQMANNVPKSNDNHEKNDSKALMDHKETPQDDLWPCLPHGPGNHPQDLKHSTLSRSYLAKSDCKSTEGHMKTPGDDSRPCSPQTKDKQQVGRLIKSSGKKSSEQTNEEKRAVFTLFKKLETLEENHRKAPAELGNYFSPPGKEKKEEVKKKELDDSVVSRALDAKEGEEDQENVYTEPGTLPINPVPKPKRTFQHPATPSMGRSLREERGRRNLPPLPSVSSKTSSKPPCGYHGRPRAERHLNNRIRCDFEDRTRSPSPVFTWSISQEHHYEDILDSSNENPYEDIELESQCSQQSIPSSPGADSTKASRPGFFRQNSGRSFKLLDLRRTNQAAHSVSSGGVSSPPQLSPPSTPTGTEHSSWIPGDPYSNTCRRIPTVVLRINGIFEGRTRKKHLRRMYHYAEAISGRVTDENSDSESEVEDRLKVRSFLRQPRKMEVHHDESNTRSYLLHQDRHQRKLFEYFLVVSLHKSKAGDHYLPEVTQQFPLKLERSFKFMRETEDQLKIIPQFCFPDAKDWQPVEIYPSEMFSFVLTGEDGTRRFGYCRRLLPSGKGQRLPEVYCIVSHLGCFNLFSKVLDEVERRRALSPALVQPFMRAIMEAQFPAPGRTINIKTFLPGSGTEVMELCRPSDSRLEHVDFECLFSCLSLRLLLRVFGSLLLERRVIFTADKLSTLSQCCHAVVALLYPFVWQHTYIPVLPSAMLDIVCTPTPFIVGLLSTSLTHLNELPLEEVLVVDLGNNRFLRKMDDEDSILPSKLQSALENVLERRRELANDRGADSMSDTSHLSTVVSEAFVRFFVELVGHYPLFITAEREDGYSSSSSSPAPCSFHREGFRKAIPSKTVCRFLEAFMETQMFGWFIQERELHRQALRGLFEVRVQEYLDSINDNEHRRVNRFLKGLGNRMKFLSKK
ncbi:DENN domain-containing protein 2A-like [Cyprinodon tularosa]|uniref:DENN domain-containing protein 2A-like n=1 Tax=Cyprinodon tularosa TaxID=77115 RepID=UPI0018E25343|nr:DENN domain-containing protein 2A-like [Cyprinodon tularosa]XP_038130491.1 DENN domain-containing protein 2A-like [Cyprinodon tularosa]